MDKNCPRIRHVPPSGRAWRAAVCLSVTVAAAIGMVAAGKAPSASACDINNHCYALAQASGPANEGGYGQLYYNCLYMPNNGEFANQEMWDASTNATYWTEVGIKSGIGYYGNYYTKEWFWADSRPNGGGYNEHEIGSTAPGSTYLPVETTYVGNNTWYIYGGNSFTQIGTSTNQPDSSSGLSEWGTEYTAGSGSGIRDIGSVYNLEWEGQNGAWNSENGLAYDAESGAGAYITPNYNASGDYLSFTGPC